ncbi:carbohydrate ABC transporter permease [Alkaliphilus serpentinus]|uniref:Carbohydrate ABC transporter permease n=1 Tax=Alkaliphilus serpentinus TaxID=1482731 RepID=A0A833HQX1_9FIRM|nr:carbohydrate ABC transporter permease [Alkaliphilus serpentinus]KAB3532464.1 carbohydrate ABC transporter permease [Alkaliphilus serpentinus]
MKPILYILIIVIAIIFILPIVYTVSNSFMDARQLETNKIEILPDRFSLNQYFDLAIFKGEYFYYFLNSVKLTTIIILGQILVGVFAAYAFAKMEFPGRDFIFLLYILVIILPFQVTMVPNYIMFDNLQKTFNLKFLDTLKAIIFPGIFTSFGVFLLRQFIRDIPNDIIEASRVDGAGDIRLFFSIILPAIRPAVFTLVILSFIDNWNIIEQAVIFISSQEILPLSVFLETIYYKDFNIFYSAATLYMFPAILIFTKGHKYLNEGLNVGGMK